MDKLRDSQNVYQDSDWDKELQSLDKNSQAADIKAAVKASVQAVGFVATFIAPSAAKKRQNSEERGDGFRDGHSGYGFYFGDIRDDD